MFQILMGRHSDKHKETRLHTAFAIAFGAASLAGRSPGEFQIVEDDCAGRHLAAGDSCRVQVRATPTGPGTRLARLRVPTSDGAVDDVALQSYTFGGTTRFTLHSPPGEGTLLAAQLPLPSDEADE